MNIKIPRFQHLQPILPARLSRPAPAVFFLGAAFVLSGVKSQGATLAWWRFEDRHPDNATGFVVHQPAGPGTVENGTVSIGTTGAPFFAYEDAPNSYGVNVRYATANGLIPSGASGNSGGVQTKYDHDGPYPSAPPSLPPNSDLFAPASAIGVLNDFTIELSLNAAAGSLALGSYQTFLGLDGTTGGPLQPFRLMRFGGNHADEGVNLNDGDLFLAVRTHGGIGWSSSAMKVLDASDFTEDTWYHLSIVGDAGAGTVSVYSYDSINQGYDLLASSGGYVGNIPAENAWTLGRGMFNNIFTDNTLNAFFDEVRFSDEALAPSQFLYADVSAVPEPGSAMALALLLTGSVGFYRHRGRRSRTQA